jgi:Holliday junction resolvasome RuvABC endonuclease subunit
MTKSRRGRRILAIDPTSRGFGYSVVEAGTLVDWGVRNVTGNRHDECLRLIAALLEQYHVDVLAVEDHTARGSRRTPRVQALLVAAAELGAGRRVKVVRVSPTRRRAAFQPSKATTKYAIAQALAHQFPELAHRLPPARKPWMSEDYRMGIFDAVALAVAAGGWHVPDTKERAA